MWRSGSSGPKVGFLLLELSLFLLKNSFLVSYSLSCSGWVGFVFSLMGWERWAPLRWSTLAHNTFETSRNEHSSCATSIKTLPSAKQEQQDCEQPQNHPDPLRKSLSWVLRGLSFHPSLFKLPAHPGKGRALDGPNMMGPHSLLRDHLGYLSLLFNQQWHSQEQQPSHECRHLLPESPLKDEEKEMELWHTGRPVYNNRAAMLHSHPFMLSEQWKRAKKRESYA